MAHRPTRRSRWAWRALVTAIESTLVAFTFAHHLTHENYIRLVMTENIHRGQFIAQSKRIQELNVTASFGISSRISSILTPGQLMKQADLALYEAKTGGRNGVVAAA